MDPDSPSFDPARPRKQLPKRLRRRARPVLTIGQVLAWADAFKAKHGRWPRATDGPVEGTVEEKWGNLNSALHIGTRGFLGGSSLPKLLAEHRDHRNRKALPTYSEEQILRWADLYQRRIGRWPRAEDGAIDDALGETWLAVDMALRHGARGLPGGTSLAVLLQDRRGLRHPKRLPDLTVEQVLAWVDAHHERTGEWPTDKSGVITGAPGETWSGIHNSLRQARRGWPRTRSLARFLAEYRSIPLGVKLPPLDPAAILKWADAFHRKHGRWPRSNDAAIPRSGGKTWIAIHVAMKTGRRGYPKGTTLAQFLVASGRGRNPWRLPPFNVEQIVRWAKAHRERTGSWPTPRSGPIVEAPGETWNAVIVALNLGRRGLPGGMTLHRLLMADDRSKE